MLVSICYRFYLEPVSPLFSKDKPIKSCLLSCYLIKDIEIQKHILNCIFAGALYLMGSWFLLKDAYLKVIVNLKKKFQILIKSLSPQITYKKPKNNLRSKILCDTFVYMPWDGQRNGILFRRISHLLCSEFRTRWFSNLGLYTFSWFRLYWRHYTFRSAIYLLYYNLILGLQKCYIY